MDALLADPAYAAVFIGALLGAGIIAGILAGLFGVGGGIIIVPVLFLMLPILGVPDEIRMHLAVGTSLATIIPTAISSTRSHAKKGSVDFALLKVWGPAIFIGALLGAMVGGRAKGELLVAIFAVIAIVVAIYMAVRKEGQHLRESLPGEPGRSAMGFLLGFISVMMGIGGGTLGVPTMTLCGFPIRRAVGTAAAIGLIIAIPGSATFLWSGLGAENLPPFSIGYVNIVAFAFLVPMTILAAPLGAKLAHRLPPDWLRRAFAIFLAITSLRMAWSLIA